MPAISIIVPIYNVERYLSVCLDSLRCQTLHDIEIICMDDGSLDRSLVIAQMHANVDSRVTVLHQENAGLSAARNAAMSHATGEYLLFIDSDDYIDRDTCEKLLAKFRETDADIITFGSKFVPNSAANDYLRTTLSPRDVEYDSFSPSILFEEASMPYACRTAVRRKFLIDNEIKFIEGIPLGEDVLFYFDIYPLAKKTVFMSNRFYSYRLTRKDSLVNTSKVNHDLTISRHIDLLKLIYKSWSQRGLMGLCPRGLLRWSIEFVMWNILDSEREKRDAHFVHLGNVLTEYFPDALEESHRTGGFLYDITKRLFDAADKGSVDDLPASYPNQYLKYLWGSKAYYRRKILAPAVKFKAALKRILPLPAESQRKYLYETADDIVDRIAEQELLTASLVLLGEEQSKGAR